MTRDEYIEKVNSVAADILTECDAKNWKKENAAEFYKFFDALEYSGEISGIIDSLAGINNWKDAVEILQVTEQNPDHVNSDLYEDCNWQKILCCIAFECFTWDVHQECERRYDADEFEQRVMAYPDTMHQLGFFPQTKTFEIHKAPWVINLSDAVKILISGKRQPMVAPVPPEFSVVFEGAVEEKRNCFIVSARRVYNQTDSNIKEDLERCLNEFEVREADDEGASKPKRKRSKK